MTLTTKNILFLIIINNRVALENKNMSVMSYKYILYKYDNKYKYKYLNIVLWFSYANSFNKHGLQ